jgi:hypothetical protein
MDARSCSQVPTSAHDIGARHAVLQEAHPPEPNQPRNALPAYLLICAVSAAVAAAVRSRQIRTGTRQARPEETPNAPTERHQPPRAQNDTRRPVSVGLGLPPNRRQAPSRRVRAAPSPRAQGSMSTVVGLCQVAALGRLLACNRINWLPIVHHNERMAVDRTSNRYLTRL